MRSSPRRAAAMCREPLIEQLAPGGRIVMPLGGPGSAQQLVKVTKRTGRIARAGEPWRGPVRSADRGRRLERCLTLELTALPRLIADAAEPLPDIDDRGFGALFDRFGDARVVCSARRATARSEFYRARAAISRRLIERHGFNIVAVEGDWPDCATSTATSATGRGARARCGRSSASRPGCGATARSTRFIRWMRRHNESRAYERMCRLLRPRPLQSQRLDARGDRLPRRGGSRARARLRTAATAALIPGPRTRRSTAATR